MSILVQILHKFYETVDQDIDSSLDPNIDIRWGDPLQSAENSFHILVAGRPSQEQLEASALLHSLIIPFAGIPAETRELLLQHFPTLNVYNLHHNAIPTAEMALALLFATAKHIIPGDRAMRHHDWRIRYRPNENLILSNRKALVLGYGAVGRLIARMCCAFGMQVDAIRRTGGESYEDDGVKVHPVTDLDIYLRQAEVVMLALPLTPQTEGLMNAQRIAQLPRQCLLVNVARGAIVDQEALFKALDQKAIAGAGLDVWYNYPTDEISRAQTEPANLPFHELDNVVMSPHRAGGSTENEHLRLRHLVELLNILAQGAEKNRVNLTEGY